MPYNEDESEKLRYACETPREKAIVELLFSTGVRADECLNIKRSDINMQERSIRILGKGNKLRTVFFNASTKLALEKYWATLPDTVEYAFVRERRPYNKMSDGSLTHILEKIAKRANVSNVIPHRFRHTFATRLEERGCPIEVIQELLGHTRVETTTRYAHQNKSRIKAEYNKYTI
jgi:site-specific recombinase XerD